MQIKNNLFTVLCHNPNDLNHNNVADIQTWARVRRYGSLTAGLTTSVLYYLYAYLRHRPLNKGLMIGAGLAGYFYFHEILWVNRFPEMRDPNEALVLQHATRFNHKVLHANGYSQEYRNAIQSAQPESMWSQKTV